MCSVRATFREPAGAHVPEDGLKRMAELSAMPVVSPPAINTSPLGRSVAVWRRRSEPMFPWAAQVPVNGSYISTITGVWTATADMSVGRFEHTATVLPGGRVLVVGGNIGSNNATASTESYDKDTGQWTPRASICRASVWRSTALHHGRPTS